VTQKKDKKRGEKSRRICSEVGDGEKDEESEGGL